MDFNDKGVRNFLLLAILNFGSFLLIVGAVYMVKNFALLYGAAVGAYTTASLFPSLAGNSLVSAILQQTSNQLIYLHKGILESYITLLVALIITGASFLMFIRRNEKNNASVRKYTLMHGAFTLVYILLFFIVISDYYTYFQSAYIYIPYLGMVICAGTDLYIEFKARTTPAQAPGMKMRHSLAIDPSKPFSNIVAMQEQLFPNLAGGHLKVIDKHFNSVALTNFHRLFDTNITRFNRVSILTSKEMMDTSFNSNLTDFRSELNELGVGLEVKLMDEKDAVDQHERIMMDDRIAYKIPPFNIINKRSEHITKINFDDAYRRFEKLNARAIKVENYNVKQARDHQPPPPPQPPQQP